LIDLEGRESIKLELEKRDKGSGFINCQSSGDVFEQGEGCCGKFNCKEYSPRNGKNGRCKHAEVAFTGTGRFFILDKKGLKEVQGYDEIVINCEAGISRSAAIAAALSKILTGDDKVFFDQFIPNRHIYRTILTEWQKQQA
jgi:hypothetical protein